MKILLLSSINYGLRQDSNSLTLKQEKFSMKRNTSLFPPGSTVPGIQIQTETEAQEEAIEELASEIVYNILRYK